jgi:hypothetical protein
LSNPIEIPTIGRETRNFGAEVRCLLTEMMKRSRKTHADIAAEMTQRLGRPVTKTMLDDFSRTDAPEREVRFPAAWVSAFCEATGFDELARLVMGERLRGFVELGERVSAMDATLQQIQSGVAKLVGPRH